MAQKFTTPITIKQLSSAGSDGLTIFVDGDTYARLQVQAGGRLVWGDGTAVGDVNLYRDEANVLKTDDTLKVPALYIDGVEIDTTGATTNQILVFDDIYWSPSMTKAWHFITQSASQHLILDAFILGIVIKNKNLRSGYHYRINIK